MCSINRNKRCAILKQIWHLYMNPPPPLYAIAMEDICLEKIASPLQTQRLFKGKLPA